MKKEGIRLTRLLPRLTIILLVLCCTQLTSGQQSSAVRMAAPDDWTHHRLIFSNPGTAEAAMQRGDYFHWLKVVNDPRFILQQTKRSRRRSIRRESDCKFAPRAGKTTSATPEPEAIVRRRAVSEQNLASRSLQVSRERDASRTHRLRWRLSAPEPAAAQGRPCDSHRLEHEHGQQRDLRSRRIPRQIFLRCQLGELQQRPVARFRNLQHQRRRLGISSQHRRLRQSLLRLHAGTVPSTYWGYNTGGTIATSVVLSFDGTQVAFAQSSSRWRRESRPAEMESE